MLTVTKSEPLPLNSTYSVHDLSEDGTLALCTNNSKVLCVWSLKDNAHVRDFLNVQVSSTTAIFSPDASAVAASMFGGWVALCVGSAKPVMWQPNTHYQHDVLCFSADASRLATGCAGTIHIWDCASQLELVVAHVPTLHFGAPRSAQFRCSDRDVFLWCGASPGVIEVSKITGPDLSLRMRIACDWADAVAESPNSKFISIGTNDGRLMLCDAEDGALITTYRHYAYEEVQWTRFSPNSRVCAYGTQMGLVLLASTRTLQILHVVKIEGCLPVSFSRITFGCTTFASRYGVVQQKHFEDPAVPRVMALMAAPMHATIFVKLISKAGDGRVVSRVLDMLMIL